MELYKTEKALAKAIWNNKEQKLALQKLFLNALSETQVPVSMIPTIWKNIENQLKTSQEYKSDGSDETI